MQISRGDQVIVRTYGGYPRIRRVWQIAGGGVIVVEDQWFRAVEDGDFTYAVTLPLEDVFRFDSSLTFDPRRPFNGWQNLTPVAV